VSVDERDRGSTLEEGEVVLLLDRQGRRTLARLWPGRRLHTHRGSIALNEVLGRREGSAVRTSAGERMIVLRPRLIDYVVEMPRQTGLVYPKDAAFVLAWADVFPGARVVEAGLGSGALTLMLLRALGPRGALTCYEVRAEFVPHALANLERFFGQRPSLVVRERDIYDGIVETDLDRVILDLPEPWRVVAHAASALRAGGIFCAYNPSMAQVQHTVAALRAHRRFAAIETLEVLYRSWVVRDEVVRPEQQMVGHTGFLTVARRLDAEEPGGEDDGGDADDAE